VGKEIGGVRDEGYGRAAIGLFLLCSLVLVFFSFFHCIVMTGMERSYSLIICYILIDLLI